MEQQDDRYLSLIRNALRVCLNYKPAFGNGKGDGVSLERFQQIYREDEFYAWFGLDSPLVYAAHKAAGGMTSVYRQIGLSCQLVFQNVLQDTLGLSAADATWSYKVKAKGAKARTLALDGRIPLDKITSAPARQRAESWLAKATEHVGLKGKNATGLEGCVFEVRQGYKSNDAKRQNADVSNAGNAFAHRYLPVMVLLSVQIPDNLAERYQRAHWLILRGDSKRDSNRFHLRLLPRSARLRPCRLLPPKLGGDKGRDSGCVRGVAAMNTDLFGHPVANGKPPNGLGQRAHLTFRGNVALGRHGWLRLTPAYSLALVRELLSQSGPDEFVLEPFSGTGTTPLACASLGIRCHAVDINPFLVWLGSLKLTRFDDGAARAVKAAAARIADKAREQNAHAWKPDLHQIEKWWDASTLHALAALCDAIRNPTCDRADGVSDLLRVAFCRVMIQIANVSFGHQSMSFKKKDDDAGLVEETPTRTANHIADAFVVAANEIADSLSIEPPIVDCRVFLGDSRDLPSVLAASGTKYTAVITSPPYPNRMSYIRELRPYMYWLGYLSDGRDAGELDWKAIGGTWGCATSMLNTWTPNGHGEIPFPHFNRIVQDIGKGHALLGRYVHKYFEDIRGHMVGLRQVLAPGARCHYIVGNSKFYDTMLPVEGIYAALFEDAGFVDVSVETIRKRTSKKELFEFIVHAHTRKSAGPKSRVREKAMRSDR